MLIAKMILSTFPALQSYVNSIVIYSDTLLDERGINCQLFAILSIVENNIACVKALILDDIQFNRCNVAEFQIGGSWKHLREVGISERVISLSSKATS